MCAYPFPIVLEDVAQVCLLPDGVEGRGAALLGAGPTLGQSLLVSLRCGLLGVEGVRARTSRAVTVRDVTRHTQQGTRTQAKHTHTTHSRTVTRLALPQHRAHAHRGERTSKGVSLPTRPIQPLKTNDTPPNGHPTSRQSHRGGAGGTARVAGCRNVCVS